MFIQIIKEALFLYLHKETESFTFKFHEGMLNRCYIFLLTAYIIV